MKKEYLPSKQFMARLLMLTITVVLIFGVYEITSYFRNRRSNLLSKPLTLEVKDVVQKDTNVNGIPDWEESLWGLDPNTNGPSNKEYILAKQKALAEENGTATNPDTTSTAPGASNNEELSQEFFAVIMSLEQTGNLDNNSLQSVSDAIGKKIIANPIPDVYTKDMANIVNSDSKSMIAYYSSLKDLFDKYKNKNIGDELSFVATALKNNDNGALQQVAVIGDAYKAFGKDLIKIPVPADLLSTHLDLANNYEKVGESIDNLTQLSTDPITGMKGIINYKKYNDALVADIQIFSDNLQ